MMDTCSWRPWLATKNGEWKKKRGRKTHEHIHECVMPTSYLDVELELERTGSVFEVRKT